MRTTVIKRTDGSMEIFYGHSNPIGKDIEYVAHPEVSEKDLDTIRNLKGNIQSELNAILSSYVNL